jgi:hypothetical protein
MDYAILKEGCSLDENLQHNLDIMLSFLSYIIMIDRRVESFFFFCPQENTKITNSTSSLSSVRYGV